MTQLSQADHHSLYLVLQGILAMVTHDQQVLYLLSQYILNHVLYLVQHSPLKGIRKLIIAIIRAYMADPNSLQFVLTHFSPYLQSSLCPNYQCHDFESSLESALEIVQLIVSATLLPEQ